MFLKLFTTGYCILLIAIFSNIIADSLELETWYKFLKRSNNIGLKKTISTLTSLSSIWLFIIYPILLSIGYIIGEKVYLFISS